LNFFSTFQNKKKDSVEQDLEKGILKKKLGREFIYTKKVGYIGNS